MAIIKAIVPISNSFYKNRCLRFSSFSDIDLIIHNSKSSSYIGTVLGYGKDATRVYSKGEIRCSEYYIGLNDGCYVGGFAGSCTNISECYSDVEISVNRIGTSSGSIGGISGVSGSISNAIFTGIVSVGNYNCNSDLFMPNVGGICGQLTNGDHIISAPDNMSYGRGLPSGLLWATKNIGAKSSEDYGYYFSWGETCIKESYYWGTYIYCNGSGTTLTKYCYSSEFGNVDNKNHLDDEDDAATVNWGKTWRLPTEAEAMELYNYCTWSLGSLNGVDGCYVTGLNGNSIFLPKAGYKQYKTTFHKGQDLYLLTSTLYNNGDNQPDYGLLIYCDNTSYGLAGEERSFGFSARAVTSNNPDGINRPTLDNPDDIIGIYDLQGKELPKVQKGINIIRYKNGSIKKQIY